MNAHTKQQQDKVFQMDFIDSQKSDPPICAPFGTKYKILCMGSSSVLVLIGSHSLCNSFVVNQFLFFFSYQMEKIPFVIHPRSNESNMVEFFLKLFISKIYSHVTQKWWPKMGMAIPYCLCWKLLHTRQKYSDKSNLFAKLQHAKAPES